MTTVADLKEPTDTEEILVLLLKMASAMNNLESAIIRGDTAMMWKLEKESDDLMQDIFLLREKTLKPYPATAPTPLTEQDSKFLPPEWQQHLQNSSN